MAFEEIKEHVWGDKKVPSNFFAQQDTDNVSAILFTNQATLTKFNRMGFLAEFGGREIEMIRFVDLYDPDPNATEPRRVSMKVHSDEYREFWREGLMMFHNPNAKLPIDPVEFPDISHAIFHEGEWKNLLHDDFPLSSVTSIRTFKE